MQRDRTLTFCVYKHTFPNGKIYIGITGQNPNRRWMNGHGYKEQPYVYNAILKFGWENIKHEVLFSHLSKEEAEGKEIELIKAYRSNRKTYGYNVANGGLTTGMVSEETKRKISEAQKGRKGNPTWLGKHHSPETKAKLSEMHKGEKNPMYGKHIPPEVKLKMSESHKRCKLCKPVVCIETSEQFVSISEAARKMSMSEGSIVMVLQGKRKSAKGYTFRFL